MESAREVVGEQTLARHLRRIVYLDAVYDVDIELASLLSKSYILPLETFVVSWVV
jgi:hypothetical protein